MIAIDTNILVAAERTEHMNHLVAKRRLHEMAESGESWAIPVSVLGEYVRVVTHPRVFNPPSALAEVLDSIDSLLGSPGVRLLLPTVEYWRFYREALSEVDARGSVIFDAQIVALCREHGVSTILTEDRDFDRFKGIKVVHLA